MAALDFPASPSNGQTYTGPGSVVWTWDGSKWVTQGIATAYLPLAGGTLTGVLGLTPGTAAAPAANFGAANTGLYGAASSVGISTNGTARLTVDAAAITAALPVVLPGAPTTALQAATKGYVDGFLPLTGGTLTGALTLAPASGDNNLYLQRAAGSMNVIYGRTGASNRWAVVVGSNAAESGSNAGSDFAVSRYADAGAWIDNPLVINRANGNITTSQSISVGGHIFMPNNRVLFGTDTGAANRSMIQLFTDNTIYVGDPNSPMTVRSSTQTRFEQGIKIQPVNYVPSGYAGAYAVNYGFPGSGYGMITRPTGDNSWSVVFMNTADAVVGSIYNTATGTSYATTSDERLKEDLKGFDAGPLIDDTNVYDFAWKTTGERSYGVMAQQANAVFPAAFNYDENSDVWGVDYSKYVPVMLQELKSLRGRVAALEGGTPTP